jgi:hypothetical protein
MSGERAMYAHPVFESHAALRLRKLHATSGSRDGRLSRHAISSRAYYARTNWLINGGALRSALAGAGAAAASEVLSGGAVRPVVSLRAWSRSCVVSIAACCTGER